MDPHHPSLPAGVHIERNRITRHDWQTYAPHRLRVTELLSSAAKSEHSTLCILGAGNGNDIDLPVLVKLFDKITLVDLDREALDHCLAQQPPDVAERIETISGADLSGMLELIDPSSARPCTAEHIDKLIKGAGNPCVPVALGTYDVVASTCLLTQMLDSVHSWIGMEDPRCVDIMLSLRDGHIRLLSNLTSPGGTLLLITDVVSTDTLGQLREIEDKQLEPLLARAIHEGNFFTGVNPGVLWNRFEDEPSLEQAKIYSPWRWQMGDRCYAVCAVSARRRIAALGP